MVTPRIGFVMGLVLFLTGIGQASAEVKPGDLTLTVTPERNGGATPFTREMVLLRIRGVYRQQILLEEMIQPSLANFSWTQLGRDRWGKTKLPDGQNALVLDRVIAIFPHHAGDFTIDPFIHRLTVNDEGERRLVDVRSEPLPLPVATWTAETGGPDAKEPWWLPARDVAITDSWSPDPETLKVGESARRIVTIEAQGLVAEGLPPRPVMRTRGILTFAGPVTRETIVTPAGPVARTTYQWDVRPAIEEIIPLDAITIAWFDTTSRTMREAEIPARQVGGGLPDQDKNALPVGTSPVTAVTAGCLAFGIGLILLGFGPGPGRLKIDRSSRHMLERAASAGDATGFRAGVEHALKVQSGLRTIWHARPDIAHQLAELDRVVYAKGINTTLKLQALARDLSKSGKTKSPAIGAKSPLKSLDGPARPLS